MKTIPYAHQYIDSKDISEVIKALKSDWITQGPRVFSLEDSLCKYTGAKFAVALSSATAALHLSMLALGVKGNDKVITSPISFAASSNCAIYVRARPCFVDIDDRTYHIDINKLKDYLKNSSLRKKVKVVVPVHHMGTVVDLIQLKKICDKYGINIVEDAAHAAGARYLSDGRWRRVGSCSHSDITVFSFHAIKHITSGEGGALLTNNKKIYEKVLRLRHHGVIKRKDSWIYDIPEAGFNYRITDFQSALASSQLRKLDRMVKRRRQMVRLYNKNFSLLSEEIRAPFERPGTYASYHLYVIRLLKNNRNELYSYLKKNNILTQVNYIPIHFFTYYKKMFGYKTGDFPVAEQYYRECLSLPLYFGLIESQQSIVVGKIKEFLKNG
jgi:UDP-4-amino-4,6-dideoxy-N-acetyl-beta-L-altrosamine transaminase